MNTTFDATPKMRQRAALRSRLFGHEFTASTTAPVTRLDGGMVEIVLCDKSARKESWGAYSFRFDGGEVAPKAEIIFSCVRKSGIVINGQPVLARSFDNAGDKLTVKLQWPGRDIPATLTAITTFQISRFTTKNAAFEIEGFAILAVTVNAE
jgi:hypothetical protein